MPKKKGHRLKELLCDVGGEMNEACRNVCIGRCQCVQFDSTWRPSRGESSCGRTLLSQDTTLTKTWCLAPVKKKTMVHSLSFPLNSQHFNDCPAVPFPLWWRMQFSECFYTLRALYYRDTYIFSMARRIGNGMAHTWGGGGGSIRLKPLRLGENAFREHEDQSVTECHRIQWRINLRPFNRPV